MPLGGIPLQHVGIANRSNPDVSRGGQGLQKEPVFPRGSGSVEDARHSYINPGCSATRSISSGELFRTLFTAVLTG